MLMPAPCLFTLTKTSSCLPDDFPILALEPMKSNSSSRSSSSSSSTPLRLPP